MENITRLQDKVKRVVLMYTHRNLFIEAVYDFIAFLVFLAGFAAVLGVISNGNYVYHAWLLIIPYYYLFFLRQTVKKLYAYIVLSLLPFLSLLIVGSIPLMVLICFALTALYLHSFYIRLLRREIRGSIYLCSGPIIMTFVASFISYISETPMPASFFTSIAALAFICAMLVTHFTNINYSLSLISSASSGTAQPVIRFNNHVILIYIAFAALFAVISSFVKLDYVFGLLGTGIGVLLRFILSFISDDAPVSQSTEDTMEQVLPVMPIDSADNGWFWDFIERAVTTVMYIILIIVIVSFIIRTVRYIYRKFYAKHRLSGDIDEFAAPLTVVSKDGILRRIKAFLPALDKNARIRRLFYKKVKAYIKKGIRLRKDCTARVIESKIAKYEDISELTAMYEKARYGKG